MPNFLFTFDTPESFRSSYSTEMAQIALQSSSKIRERLRSSFGLGIDISSDPIRMMHDGQRVGIGSFIANNRSIHFTIGSKTAFSVEELLTELQEISGWSIYVKYGAFSNIPVDNLSSDFTPTFLVGLYNEIAEYARHHQDFTHLRREEMLPWKIRGRPNIPATLRLIAAGRMSGIICNICDDNAFQDYANVLVATAGAIQEQLMRWNELVSPIQSDLDESKRTIFTRLKPIVRGTFSFSLLLKVCRPPFPFGLRDLLYKCMRFWEWNGNISVSSLGGISNYRELVLRLDKIFELYVGYIFNKALSDQYEWTTNSVFEYSIKCSGGHEERKEIKPDHIFTRKDRNSLLVVDAKYRRDIASEDSVYQMLSYLDLQLTENIEQKTGLLVYPGSAWQVRKIVGFKHDIYCLTMPISAIVAIPCINGFIDNL